MQKTDGRLDHIDVRDLRLLAVLIETRSVTRTAEILGLSQPAASRALEKVRRVLGDRVVVRSAAGATLTPRGHVIARQVTAVLDAIGRLFESDVFDHRIAQSTIRVAATDYGATVVAGPLAAYFLKEAPGLELEVSGFTSRTFEDLALGNLDLALYADAELPPDFHAIDLFAENYACLIRADHPALKPSGAEADILLRLAQSPRAVMLFPDGRRLLQDDVLSNASTQPLQKIGFATPYFFSAPAAVAGSDMVMCLPARAAALLAAAGELRAIPMPHVPGFIYRLVWHERCDQDRQHVWIREAVRRISAVPQAGTHA